MVSGAVMVMLVNVKVLLMIAGLKNTLYLYNQLINKCVSFLFLDVDIPCTFEEYACSWQNYPTTTFQGNTLSANWLLTYSSYYYYYYYYAGADHTFSARRYGKCKNPSRGSQSQRTIHFIISARVLFSIQP